VLERLTFSAAAKDKEFSQHLQAFGARIIGPARFPFSGCSAPRDVDQSHPIRIT
jgi:hypothetical protein